MFDIMFNGIKLDVLMIGPQIRYDFGTLKRIIIHPLFTLKYSMF